VFKDLDKNGKLDPYEDWRLPAAVRAAELLKRRTLAEKVGRMMLANNGGFIGPQGELLLGARVARNFVARLPRKHDSIVQR
jgi:beta-glucosidase